MELIEFFKQNGPWAVLAFLLVKWFIDKGWPQMAKWLNRNQDSAIKKEDAELQAESEERARKARIEERQTVAMEAVAHFMPLFDLRMSNVEADMRVMRDNITTLVERKATVTTTTIPT